MMRKRSTLRSAALPAALGGLAILYGVGIPQIRSQFDEGIVGPRFLPILLVIIALGCVAVIIGRAWRRPAAASDAGPASAPAPPVPAQRFRDAVKPYLLLGAILLYIALFKPLGFLLTTFGLGYAILTLFSYAQGRLLRRAGMALAITLGSYGLFMLAFGARLPLFPELLPVLQQGGL